MSKSASKSKNPLVVQSDDEDETEEVPTTSPESEASEMCPAELLQPVQEMEAIARGHSPSPEGWQLLISQLGQLLQSTVRLVSLMSEAGAQPCAPIAALEWERALTAIFSPATFELGANFSTDATQ
ncbi:unnamed protein product [Lampetra planeri]